MSAASSAPQSRRFFLTTAAAGAAGAGVPLQHLQHVPCQQVPTQRAFASEAATIVQQANLPTRNNGEEALSSADLVAAFGRLADVAEEHQILFESLLDTSEGSVFLTHAIAATGNLTPEDTRQLVITFAKQQHMPFAFWEDGFAAAVQKAVTELPDIQVVHIALLLSTFDLVIPVELLQEIADQMEIRSSSMSPTALAGAMMALSQLGPWPSFVSSGVAEELVGVASELTPRELSASALAAATLGVDNPTFWHRIHGELSQRANELAPRHVADALLTVATNGLLPISLLESLQDRLPNVVTLMSPDAALTAVWSLAALRMFPTKQVPRLLEQVLPPDVSPENLDFTQEEARQLKQVALSLELDSSAKRARESLGSALQQRLDAVTRGQHLGSETVTADDEIGEEICSILMEVAPRALFQVHETVADMYVVDLSIKQGDQRSALILDAVSPADAEAPRDPWTTLKLRHLALLGWKVRWLPVQKWSLEMLDEESRKEFVKDFAEPVVQK